MDRELAAKLANELIALAVKIKEVVTPERPWPRVFKNISGQRIMIRQNPGGIGGETRYINPGEFIEADEPEDGRDDHGNKCLIVYARQVLVSSKPFKGHSGFTANGKWRTTMTQGYVDFYPEMWEEQIDED